MYANVNTADYNPFLYPYQKESPIDLFREVEKYKYDINWHITNYFDKKTEEKKLMYLYNITVIDKVCNTILYSKNVIAKDEKSAMLDLDLTKDIKAKVKKDEIAFIFDNKGSYEPTVKDSK